MKRKICVITGSRAEYGLLYWLMREIQEDSELTLQLIVSGMHLSPEFGLTYRQIEKDGFDINEKIEILLSSDTPVGITKSMGLAMISFAETYERLKPDIIAGMGDRFELFAAVSAAVVARLPVAHLNGGEITEGVIDDPLRHAITKMSHLHFTAMEEYRQRVIQLGEDQARVFTVGEAGLDNIRRLQFLSKEEFEKAVNFKLHKKNILVTFHPVTIEKSTAHKHFREILEAVDTLEETGVIFTMPNADTDGRIIINMINEYVTRNKEKAVAFVSLGQQKYLSALQYVDAVVGNSSSGIVEAPSFKIGTIDIGDRQKGRVKSKSIIECLPQKDSILQAFTKLYSKEFSEELKNVKNPYGEGKASVKIKEFIKSYNLEGLIPKKFCDIKLKPQG